MKQNEPSTIVDSSFLMGVGAGGGAQLRAASLFHSGCRRRRSRGTRLRRLGAPVSHLILRAGAGGCVVCGEAGSSAGGLAASAGPVGAGTPARLDVSLCYIRCAWQRVTPACHVPWHPEDGRCAVSRAGPEDWARWALWGRASTSSGQW
jgi:hypothetical protein